jgi:Tol biopolymer transport system component
MKMLPNAEAKGVTDDARSKYGPTFSPDGSRIAYTVVEDSHFATYFVSVLGGDSHFSSATQPG